MEENLDKKVLKAFVLMPFSTEFDDVFKHIICDTISCLGFATTRADELKNSRNIMHDVIQGILEADLIIADITGANPNVYYELGIAHAKEKKVVLLTQEVDDIPFDLRAYRIITYSTHFAQVEQAKLQLLETAKNSLNESSRFSNPVMDYYATENKRLPSVNFSDDEILTESPEENGILDFIVDVEDGINDMTIAINEAGAGLNKLVPLIESTTTKINSKPKISTKEQRSAIRELAHEMNNYAYSLRSINNKYRAALSLVTQSLDGIFSIGITSTHEENQEFLDFQSRLLIINESAVYSRDMMSDLAKVLDELPAIEKEFNRSKRTLSEEVKSLTNNIDLTISNILRANIVNFQPDLIEIEER